MDKEDLVQIRAQELKEWLDEDPRYHKPYAALKEAVRDSLLPEAERKGMPDGEKKFLNDAQADLSYRSAGLLREFCASLAEREVEEGKQFDKDTVYSMVSRWIEQKAVRTVTIIKR